MEDKTKEKKAERDVGFIIQIAERAFREGFKINKFVIAAYIAATHINCPLNLHDLLVSSPMDFCNDINGINCNINKETLELMNCFVPKFAKSQH